MWEKTLKLRFIVMVLFISMASVHSGPISVANHSFEFPVIDPNDNPLYAIPIVSLWRELDIDTEYSTNTGTFKNTPADSNDHISNADGGQLALLGNQQGNGLQQELPATYQVGKSYQLTVGVCVSMRYPPPSGSSLTLAFYYVYGTQLFDIVTTSVPAEGLMSGFLTDFSLSLPAIETSAPWAGKNIGIAIRSAGSAFAYWDLDNVRLMELPLTPDFTGDSLVNLADYAKIASEWLSCSQVTADLSGEGCVNGEDLLILAEYWLDNV